MAGTDVLSNLSDVVPAGQATGAWIVATFAAGNADRQILTITVSEGHQHWNFPGDGDTATLTV